MGLAIILLNGPSRQRIYKRQSDISSERDFRKYLIELYLEETETQRDKMHDSAKVL